MISDAKIELRVEEADELQQSAEQVIESEPGLAAEQFRQAALIYFEIASNVEDTEAKKRYMTQGLQMKRRADVLQPDDADTENTPLTVDPSDDDTEQQQSHASREPEDSEFFQTPPDLSLSDVGGMAELQETLRENVQKPLENPKFYEQQGVGIQNGILFYGPPGTGKSYLAECFAGELGYRYAEIKASEISSKWVGEAPKNIKQLFEEAREPCVVFLDEVDALATDRGGGPEKTNSERQIVTELLQQMQAIQGSDILVIAATNKPEDLDAAITRSQRFNTKFHVGPPDAEARQEILKVQLEDEDRAVDWESMNWRKLIEWSQGFSAADLADVVQQAARESASESTDHGSLVPVQYRHVLAAMKQQQASLKDYNR